MLEEIFAGVSSVISGGATGLIGTAITNVTDYFETKRDQNHALAMRDKDITEMDKEYEHRKDITAQKTAADTQEASYQHDSRSYTAGLKLKSPWLKAPLVFVDFARGLVRIILTLYLMVLVQIVFWQVQEVLREAGVDGLDVQDALSLYAKVINLILYIASTCILWWFGSRTRANKPKPS